MYNYQKLKGKIIENYETLGNFAKNGLKITPTQFSRILNGQCNFTQRQICLCIELLNINNDEIGSYFFTK